jgi:RimJ/RimL family protein N-acetyltransferase
MTTPRKSKAVPIAPIHTQRLVLRPFLAGDWEQMKRLVDHPAVRAPHGDEPRALSAAAAAEKGRPAKNHGAVELAIVARRTGRLVGACELIVGPRRTGEIGYLLGRRHWGHGYATEVARALVAYGFDGLGLRQLYAVVSLDNPRSRRVLVKAGFAWDALLQRRHRTTGPALDAERYTRLAASSVSSPCRPTRTRR